MMKIRLLTHFSSFLYSRMSKDLSLYVPIFNGTNYQEWYEKLEAFTMAMKWYKAVTNDPPVVGAGPPVVAQADLDKFNKMDQQVRGFMRLRLGASYQSHMLATAKLSLAALKAAFGTPGRIGAL